MKKSDLRRHVAELLVIRASGHLYDSQRQYPKWELDNRQLKRLLGEGVGGVIVFGGTSCELVQRTKTLRNWAQQTLLLCADIEEGLGQRFKGGTWLAPPLAVGQIHDKDPEKARVLAEKYGSCIGFQARACGLNWVLAPVCDINTNPNNPVINMRAWGEDPATVSDLITAFHRGLASQGVLTCAKHFPGHGDSSVDSHLELPILKHDLNRLEEVELLPFQAAIASGADSLMSAHVLLPKIDSKHPATLSVKIHNLLRESMGFDGLLVTDALVMEAITKTFGGSEAAVMAFAAGADLLMMPENPDGVINAICEAILSGRVPITRLEKALQRRKTALAKIESNSFVFTTKEDKDGLLEVEREEDRLLSKDLIINSIEIRNQGCLEVNHGGINLLRVDSVLPCPFLPNLSPALSLPQGAGYRTVIFHQLGIPPWQDDPDEPLDLTRFGEGSFLVQLFVRGNPFRGELLKEELWVAAIRQLQRRKRLCGLVVYGSPYLWNEIIEVLDTSIPASYSPGQMPKAQEQALVPLFHSSNLNEGFQSHEISDFTD